MIQTENNYEKEVFNGDIGLIEIIDSVEQEVSIRFDQRLVKYDFGELDAVSLAYAVTVHKAQGSEFPAVVYPASDAAVHAAPAQSHLHRHYAGQESGRTHRTTEGTAYCRIQQQDAATILRPAGSADINR